MPMDEFTGWHVAPAAKVSFTDNDGAKKSGYVTQMLMRQADVVPCRAAIR